MFTAIQIENVLRPLRADGLFLEAVAVTDVEFTLISTTYVTDTDPDEGDCLCVDPSVQHAGDGPCTVCVSFTLGFVQEVPRGSVKCPCCNRYTKPLALRARHRAHVFYRTTEGGIAAADGTMQAETVAKIIAAWVPPTIFDEGENPPMLVFDVDYTLWPFDCDNQVIAPFNRSPYGGVHDRFGRLANVFIDVPSIFAAAVDAGITVAIASRNPSAGPVESLLRATPMAPRLRPELSCLWDAIPDRAVFNAYSSGGMKGKTKHFKEIQAVSGLPFADMLFFDDIDENVLYARAMGVTAVRVDRAGLTWAAVNKGIREWREARTALRAPDALAVAETAALAEIRAENEPPVDINFTMPLRSPFEAEDLHA
jgi:magnesium-dependent phosphatase 1